jgi:hypothetical protein
LFLVVVLNAVSGPTPTILQTKAILPFNMKASPEKSLILELDPDWIPGASRFFQDGVMLEARLGSSVQAFLLERLGLSREYVEARIQTILLNGKVVDDPTAAAIQHGAVLSLSAAMP